MNASPSKDGSRIFQFRLRTLLLIAVFVCIVTANNMWWINRMNAQRLELEKAMAKAQTSLAVQKATSRQAQMMAQRAAIAEQTARAEALVAEAEARNSQLVAAELQKRLEQEKSDNSEEK